MTPEERTTLSAMVAAERRRTAANEAGLVAELESVIEASAQANLDDEHDPEGATVGYERARVASLLAAARARLTRLDQAADRLEAGAYGACGRCGNPIPIERLVAHPAAVTCVACEADRARSPLYRR
ncbi:MAG: TraR/DksA C4-type zinc finger protein [Actinomycetota bacterium]|nr:TraR/DksA C4-type zinc finger protein [Actinomycetota bacterium]